MKKFYAYVKYKTKSRPTVGPLTGKDFSKITNDKGDNLISCFSSVFNKGRCKTLANFDKMRKNAEIFFLSTGTERG